MHFWPVIIFGFLFYIGLFFVVDKGIMKNISLPSIPRLRLIIGSLATVSVLCLIAFFLIPQFNPNKTEGASGTTDTIINLLASVLFGGLGGSICTIWYYKHKEKQEYRSLILAFCAEAVLAFKRCVACWRQFYENIGISKTTLFTITDQASFSRFASVCEKPDVVNAIITIKNGLFHIGRHIDDAAGFASRSETLGDPQIDQLAAQAQKTAVGFMKDHYISIESNYSAKKNQEVVKKDLTRF